MNFSQANLKDISVHYVGNKTYDQKLDLSEASLQPDSELSVRLCNYFLERFSDTAEHYRFTHASDLQFNEIYSFVKDCFHRETSVHDASVKIARHLYESSVHPKVRSGELYVCHFDNCYLENQPLEVIGIFKTEVKAAFFEIDQQRNEFHIAYKEGIDINKLEKGCLIFNINEAEGYHVVIIDQQNRGEEALYWKGTFLGLGLVSNEFHQTKEFLTIAKNFVTQQYTEDFNVSRADQIDLLNRSVDYFKNHETFDKEEFATEVFQDKEIIQSFRRFDESYRELNEIDLDNNFSISQQAVKKQARVFKSVLKLDKNFHVYIHGDRDMIEQGIDEDGRKYYKLYFFEES